MRVRGGAGIALALVLGGGATLAQSVTLLAAPSISLGHSHACAVTSGGEVYCWGGNTYGQLGDGTDRSSPLPVRVLGLPPAQRVAVHASRSCAVDASGDVWCWGLGARGLLGDGAKSNQAVPVRALIPSGEAVDVSLNGRHGCALLRLGQVRCWDEDINGQYGSGFEPRTPARTGRRHAARHRPVQPRAGRVCDRRSARSVVLG